MQMQRAELVFIPFPWLSHLVSTMETAKLLLDLDDRLSVTVLIMKLPQDTTIDSYIKDTYPKLNISSRLRFINLPRQEQDDQTPTSKTFLSDFIENQTIYIREIVSNLIKQPSAANSQLAGLVLDMFLTKYVEVAEEFSVPAYVFFTAGACTLGLFQHLASLRLEHHQELKQYKNSNIELSVPCFSNPVPAKVLPAPIVDGDVMADIFLNCIKRISETKGIMVNTFYELESFAIEALLSDSKTPKVYPIGPILNLSGSDQSGDHGQASNSQSFDEDVKKWLDDQPENSVVFLCFGTMGSFEATQVKEIAFALESSGSRFLWSLRKPGKKGMAPFVTEYENFEQVLPEGFLERTKGIGKVIGWAPQVAVLSHTAVGGFVSHCGWNSTLESVWFGVPIATFPLYSEQQLNAFQLVKEQGMAEMIRIDYKIDLMGETPPEIVGSEEIEAAIRRLMAEEGGSAVRQKVKEMQNKARSAFLECGSSYNAQCHFIEDVIRNIS